MTAMNTMTMMRVTPPLPNSCARGGKRVSQARLKMANRDWGLDASRTGSVLYLA